MINAEFFYWGPLLFKYELPNDVMQEVHNLVEESKALNIGMKHGLSLKFNNEISILNKTKDKFESILNPYVTNYINFYNTTFSNNHNTNKKNKTSLLSSWINFQQKGEYRPPHIHSEDISFVLYVDIPEQLKEEHRNYAPEQKRGSIYFTWASDSGDKSKVKISPNVEFDFFPVKGQLFIFPSYLSHYSMNFFSDCVRTSISGNIVYEE